MVSFEGFRAEDGSPIYLQIIRYIKQGVVSGEIADGDELPSRRVLSAILGLNPNTVQKACRALEEEGLIASHAGDRSFAVVTPEIIAACRAELVRGGAESWARAARGLGLGLDEALELIREVWDCSKEGEEP